MYLILQAERTNFRQESQLEKGAKLSSQKPVAKQGNEVSNGNIFLRLRLHMAYGRSAFRHFIIAKQNGIERVQTIRLPEMSFE